MPKISIIIPVYQAQGHLERTIQSIRNQTFTDFEVIFVDDQSTDHSLTQLQKAAEGDRRFTVLTQAHAGAGAARNRGMEAASGDYFLFSDSDDLYDPSFLEKMYHTARTHCAQITACNFVGVDRQGREFRQKGVHEDWVSGAKVVFSYEDCPVNILRIAGSMVWNKLFSSAFVRAHGLQFDNIQTCNDLSFTALSMAAADRIALCTEHLIRYEFPRLNNPKNIDDVFAAVVGAACRMEELPHAQKIRNAIVKFAAENLIASLKRDVKDFNLPKNAAFYQRVHGLFCSEIFMSVRKNDMRNDALYLEFATVRKHDYDNIKKLISRPLIVSLTSYPARIHCVASMLETIYAQTRKPRQVVLWLAQEQFPEKEAELPEQLRALARENRLTIRWCEDLKPHKKYFWALQEYKEDLVVTVDDDLLYAPDMLENLFRSYLLYPDAVSAMRAHLIIVNEDGKVLPYRDWIMESDGCLHTPSMQLMATGGAGALYPPELFGPEFFDIQAIRDNCIHADDLWLKAMQLASDVPVVLVRPFEPLRYVPDSQNETLYALNVGQEQNDVQIENIARWMQQRLGKNLMVEKLTRSDIGQNILGVEAVSRHLNQERVGNRWKGIRTEQKLKQVQDHLQQSQFQIRQTQVQLSRTKAEMESTTVQLQQSRDEQAKLESGLAEAEMRYQNLINVYQQLQLESEQTEKQLRRLEREQEQMQHQLQKAEDGWKKTEEKLREAEENAPIGRQLENVGIALRKQREAGEGIFRWGCKRFVYLLAWIPEKMLAGMMYYLRNGAKQTIKRIFRK